MAGNKITASRIEVLFEAGDRWNQLADAAERVNLSCLNCDTGGVISSAAAFAAAARRYGLPVYPSPTPPYDMLQDRIFIDYVSNSLYHNWRAMAEYCQMAMLWNYRRNVALLLLWLVLAAILGAPR